MPPITGLNTFTSPVDPTDLDENFDIVQTAFNSSAIRSDEAAVQTLLGPLEGILRDTEFAKSVKLSTIGAVGDGLGAKGGMSGGSDALTTDSDVFTAADVGKVISVPGAGPGHGVLVTTIDAFVTASHVLLSTTATYGVAHAEILYGTNDGPAFEALSAGIWVVPPGLYLLSTNVVMDEEVVLVFSEGASLALLGTSTFEFRGEIVAGRYRIFESGAGSLTGSRLRNREIYPEWWGARGDVATAEGGTITTGTNVLTTTSSSFTSADVGKRVGMAGAGELGAALATTIVGFNSATQVTLAINASSTVSGVGQTVTFGTDDTNGLNQAIAAVGVFAATAAAEGASGGAVVSLRGTTYLIVGGFDVPDDVCIETAGQITVLQQLTGGPPAQLIRVKGSNVSIGDLTVRGHIATDTGEHSHGIFVRGPGAIRNIRIGRIRGEDLRGDVVSIGGTTSAPVYDVDVEDVYGDNVIRCVASVTGGENVRFHSVNGVNVGFFTFDAEPNPSGPSGGQPCTKIRVDYVKGACVGVVGGSGATGMAPYNGEVSFGFLDLDPAYSGNSTPAYSAHDASRALVVRNTRFVHVESLYANGHATCAVFTQRETSVNDLWVERVSIENCTIPVSSTVDTSYDSYILNFGCRCLVINGGTVGTLDAMPGHAKRFILGLASDPQPVMARNVTCPGELIRCAKRSRFENVVINNAYHDRFAFNFVTESTVEHCSVTLGRLAGNSSRIRFHDVQATVNTLFDTSTADHRVEDCTFNGVYYKDQIWNRSYVNARGMGNPSAFAHYQWVDATGRMRAKLSVPASDTDGYVETQGRRLTADVAIAASATISLSELDVALVANSGQYILDYEIALDVTGGTAGLKPRFTLPGFATARFSAWGDAGAVGTLTGGASTTAPTTTYATAFATAASLTGATIRGRLVVAMSGTAGTVHLDLISGASAAGNVLANSSVTVSRV